MEWKKFRTEGLANRASRVFTSLRMAGILALSLTQASVGASLDITVQNPAPDLPKDRPAIVIFPPPPLPCEIAKSADFAVTLTDNLDPFNGQTNGTPLTYELEIVDHGPDFSEGIEAVVTVNLHPKIKVISAIKHSFQSSPREQCEIADKTVTCPIFIPQGGAGPKQYRITLVTIPSVTGPHTTIAEVTANKCDPVSTNNTAMETTTITAIQDNPNLRTLTVIKSQGEGAGAGSVTSINVPGINCVASCPAQFGSFPLGTVVQLEAIKSVPTDPFEGWTGDPDCNDGIVTMTADRQCTARFAELADVPTSFKGDFGVQVPIGEERVKEFFSHLAHPMSSGQPTTFSVSSARTPPLFIESPTTFILTPGKTLGDNTPPNSVRIRFSPLGTECGPKIDNLVIICNEKLNFRFSGGGFDDTINREFFAVGVIDSRPLLRVVLAGPGRGTVSQQNFIPGEFPDEVGIDCPAGTCGKRYISGTEVTLEAEVGAGATFAGWSGNGCSGNTLTCTVTMSADRTVTAMFDLAITDPIKNSYDFDGDGMADLMWRNTSTGSTAIWLMNGTVRASVGFPGGVPLNWQIAGIGDVTGDNQADVIWRNSNNGAVAVWVMNGTRVTTTGFPGSSPTAWVMTGLDDVDGDGKADLIWRNSITGSVAIWLMNGTIRGSVDFPGGVPLNWQIAGIGDVTGDNQADVIWRNSSNGAVAVWVMNGTRVTTTGFPGSLSTDWKIASVGDFNGDNKADLIWKNDSSQSVAIWLMNGAFNATQTLLGNLTSAWEIAQVADVDGNGKADVIWHNSSNGAVAVWVMNGTTVTTTGFPGSAPTEWHIRN